MESIKHFLFFFFFHSILEVKFQKNNLKSVLSNVVENPFMYFFFFNSIPDFDFILK